MVTVKESLLKKLILVMIVFLGHNYALDTQNIFSGMQLKTEEFKAFISRAQGDHY
jgi:hypothetical protein